MTITLYITDHGTTAVCNRCTNQDFFPAGQPIRACSACFPGQTLKVVADGDS